MAAKPTAMAPWPKLASWPEPKAPRDVESGGGPSAYCFSANRYIFKSRFAKACKMNVMRQRLLKAPQRCRQSDALTCWQLLDRPVLKLMGAIDHIAMIELNYLESLRIEAA